MRLKATRTPFAGTRNPAIVISLLAAILWPSLAVAYVHLGMVKDIAPASLSPYVDNLIAFNGLLYFTASPSGHREIWKSDGTEAGTVRVVNIDPIGPQTAAYEQFTVINGTLYFSGKSMAYAPDNWLGLWKTDGTEAGTVLVKGFPVSNMARIHSITGANDSVFFCHYDGVGAYELWKTDGTETGTVLVKTFSEWAPPGSQRPAVAFQNQLFFAAGTAWQDCDLWRSDGTESGTTIVKQFSDSDYPFVTQNLRVVNSTLFFEAWMSPTSMGVWRSNGTQAGTVLVTEAFSDEWLSLFFAGMTPPEGLELPPIGDVMGAYLYFPSCTATGSALWKSNGSPWGTSMVRSFSGMSALPWYFTTVGDTLFFMFFDLGTPWQVSLWKSNGQLSGTVLVHEFSPGLPSFPLHPLAFGDRAVFRSPVDPASGSELWESDGTDTGTRIIADINPGSANASPGPFVNVNGTLFFPATDPTYGRELWTYRVDNTPPQAEFAATPTSGSAPLDVQFTDLSVPGASPIADWQWDFGDGMTSHEQHPSHQYESNGAYTVTLTVTAPEGADVAMKTWYVVVGDVLPVMDCRSGIAAIFAFALTGALLIRKGRRAVKRIPTSARPVA